jgi:hypothetical protein
MYNPLKALVDFEIKYRRKTFWRNLNPIFRYKKYKLNKEFGITGVKRVGYFKRFIKKFI